MHSLVNTLFSVYFMLYSSLLLETVCIFEPIEKVMELYNRITPYVSITLLCITLLFAITKLLLKLGKYVTAHFSMLI